MAAPIRWDNVGENAGNASLANSVGGGWAQAAKGFMGFREQPREDRAEQRAITAHDLKQQMGMAQLADQQFENSVASEVHDVDMLVKRAQAARAGYEAGNSPMQQKADKFILDHIIPGENMELDEDAILRSAPDSGASRKSINEAVDRYKQGSRYYRTKAAETEIQQETAKMLAKNKAKQASGTRKAVKTDPTIEASLLNFKSDEEQQLAHRMYISDLTAAGMSLPAAIAEADKGIQPSFFTGARIFNITPAMTKKLADERIKHGNQ